MAEKFICKLDSIFSPANKRKKVKNELVNENNILATFAVNVTNAKILL